MDNQWLYFPKTGSNINAKIKDRVVTFFSEKNVIFQESPIAIFWISFFFSIWFHLPPVGQWIIFDIFALVNSQACLPLYYMTLISVTKNLECS